MDTFINRKWPLFLGGVLFLHWITNLIWLRINNSPIPWDPAAHTWIVLDIIEKFNSFNFVGILYSSNYYPIFVHTLTAVIFLIPSFLITNPIEKIRLIELAGTIYLLVTISAVYFYSYLKLKNHLIALLSCIIFSFFPIIYSDSKWLYLDIPLTGMLLYGLIFLEKSHLLTRRLPSVLFFIFAGLLIMTKWTAIIYLVIPSIFVLIKVIQHKKLSSVLPNLLIGLIPFALITLPWYLINISSLLSQTKINIIGETGADPSNLFGIENIFLYLKYFVNYQVTPLITLLFIISSLYLIKTKNKLIYFFLIMLGFVYLVFTFISNKDPRYTMPLLPFVAIIISTFLVNVREKYKTLRLGIFLIPGLLFIYFLILTLRPPALEKTLLPVYLPIIGWHANIIDISDPLVKRPDNNYWNMNDILNDFSTINDQSSAKILIASEYEHLNASTIRTYAKSANLTKISLGTPDIYYLVGKYNANNFPSTTELEKYLNSFDYALIPVNQVGTEFLRNKPALEQIRSYFSLNSLPLCSDFITLSAPKNSTCYIRENEKLETTSDIYSNGSSFHKGDTLLSGPATITCQWGCTFGKISFITNSNMVFFKLLKTYTLPNHELINLYKIN